MYIYKHIMEESSQQIQEQIIYDTLLILYIKCRATGITTTMVDTADLYQLLMQTPKYHKMRNDEMFIKAINNIDINSLNLELIQKIEETL